MSPGSFKEGRATDYESFRISAQKGLEDARVALASYTGKELELATARMTFLDLREIPLLAGDPEAPVLASYCSFEGEAEGQLLMLFRPDTAERLVTFLAPEVFEGIAPHEIMPLMDSLILEVANVVGSCLINSIADGAGIVISPSPPVLVRDMAGAVLGSALTYSGLSDAVYVVHIQYSLSGGKAMFEIAFLPKVSSEHNFFAAGDGIGECTTT
jgi:chemotaxis protein CheY-P-specific phosphatase CheC